jgi:biopolymer transport protein ExbD
VADEGTPYRLLVEILYTLGQAEFGKFHLMVLQSPKK